MPGWYQPEEEEKPLGALGALIGQGANLAHQIVPQVSSAPLVPSFESNGKQLGDLYHGSNVKISAPDSAKIQSRDYGFYGKGFYVTKSPQYAKSYGGRVSKFNLADDARVLMGSLKPEESSQSLIDAVKQDYMSNGLARAQARGKEAQFMDELNSITSSPSNWKSALSNFGERNGYDAIHFSPGEIVIKNLSKIKQ